MDNMFDKGRIEYIDMTDILETIKEIKEWQNENKSFSKPENNNENKEEYRLIVIIISIMTFSVFILSFLDNLFFPN